jgi:uncharacterized OB-fold protein
MAAPSRMPRYDIRNDGVGPYAVFYCEICDREYRSQPELAATITQDVTRRAGAGLLRNIPILGGAMAESVSNQDPRYITSLTPQQLEKAWNQVKDRFRECPTCRRIVCISDWDEQSGYCTEDSPRRDEIIQAQAEQAGAAIKGLASAFGLGAVIDAAKTAAKQASASTARCPKDGTLAPAGTKFCPNCGSPMIQPAANICPSCGATAAPDAKFCPECGAKLEQKPAGVCPKCGAQAPGAKFCPQCGSKMG